MRLIQDKAWWYYVTDASDDAEGPFATKAAARAHYERASAVPEAPPAENPEPQP